METLTQEQAMMLANVAAGLNGGKYISRITDETILSAARDIVIPQRVARAKANAAKRQATLRERIARDKAQRAEWLATWKNYSDIELSRIDAVFAAFKDAPKRSLMRRMAKRLFRTHPESGIVCTDKASCYCADCLPMDNWRETAKRYSVAMRAVRIAGEFPISRFDMEVNSNSRFYRNVVKHWHNYAGGKHVAIHGVTPDDVLQDAFVAAIENGDTVEALESRRMDWDGIVEMRAYSVNIPTFGNMYMHTRQATESAVYTYRRGHAHSEDFTTWTWSDWQAWAESPERRDIALRVRYSTDAEWQAYHAAKRAEAKRAKAEALIAADRDAALATMEESRAMLARLILTGMPVHRIAKLIGRTVESIADGMEATRDTVAARWL